MFHLLKTMMSDGEEPPLRCTALIMAAGQGTRMNREGGKQLIKLLGRPIISYTLEVFQNCKAVDDILLVVREEDLTDMRDVVEAFGIEKVSSIIVGGDTRQKSVENGLRELDLATSLVLIHDGARPFVTEQEVEDLIGEAASCGAAALGIPVKDTIKKVDENLVISETPPRELLWAIATPQAFSADLIREAHEAARRDQFSGTDDCMLVERLGCPVQVVPCSSENIKITTPEDLFVAERILESRGDEW